MAVNSLVPVFPSGVEYRPLPELYSAGVVAERFDNEALHQVTGENGVDEHKLDLFSFRSRGGLWQRVAYLKDFSFKYSRSFRESGYVRSSIKSNIKLSGTYDMNGEIYTSFKEKGIYIDQFS